MSNDTTANDPRNIDSVRAQLDRAEAERKRQFKPSKRQRQVLESINRAELETERALANAIANISATARPGEGLHSARRINEALRPKAPNSDQSVTATDPYLLSKSIPVLRLVNSKFERTEYEPIPFETIAKVSAQRFSAGHGQKTNVENMSAYRRVETDAYEAILAAHSQLATQRKPRETRLQRLTGHSLASRRRTEFAMVATALLAAAISIVAFYLNYRPGA